MSAPALHPSSAPPRPRVALVLLVFVVALAPRLWVLFGAETYRFDPADNYIQAGWETGRIAANLAEGRGFLLQWGPEPAPTAWVAPLYPYGVALAFRVFSTLTIPSFVAVMLFQVLCSALTSVLLYVLGTRLGQPAAGVMAGVLYALSPSAIRESADAIVSISLLILLLVLIVAQLVVLDRRPSVGRGALTGVLMGLTLLTEPSPVAFFLAAAVWLAVRRGRHGMRAALIMGTIAGLVVAPWIVRNYRLFGEAFFVKSNFGQELFIGNNPEATGFWMPPGEVARRTLDPATLERLNAAWARSDEPAFSRMLGKAAIEYIGDHPARSARLAVAKAVLFWTHEYEGPSWPLGERAEAIVARAARVLQLVVLPLALAGVFLALRSGGGLVLPVLFLAVYPATYVLTHIGHDRYRLPTLAFLHLLAAVALLSAVERGRRGA